VFVDLASRGDVAECVKHLKDKCSGYKIDGDVFDGGLWGNMTAGGVVSVVFMCKDQEGTDPQMIFNKVIQIQKALKEKTGPLILADVLLVDPKKFVLSLPVEGKKRKSKDPDTEVAEEVTEHGPGYVPPTLVTNAKRLALLPPSWSVPERMPSAMRKLLGIDTDGGSDVKPNVKLNMCCYVLLEQSAPGISCLDAARAPGPVLSKQLPLLSSKSNVLLATTDAEAKTKLRFLLRPEALAARGWPLGVANLSFLSNAVTGQAVASALPLPLFLAFLCASLTTRADPKVSLPPPVTLAVQEK
jgi:hypothetical protein